jgi:cation diffusion facilitator family transporter
MPELENDENRLSFKKGEKAAKLSTIILLALGILRGIVSFTSGSVALLAGTIDSFSDVLSSIAVWAGLRIARKKPSERFPYGYYKAETFALLIVSTIIIVSSIFIMLESFQKFFETSAISFLDIALLVSAVSMVIYYLLARYKTRIGRQIGSQALISEGLHSKIDVYTSILVFVGVFLAFIGFQFGEALIGFLIGTYVLARGILFGKDAVLVLMDVSPSPQRVREMKKIAESIPGVKGTHDVRLRKSGPVFFGEMHLEMQEGLSLEKAHIISENVEAIIKAHFDDLELITVHAGLTHSEKTKIAIPVEQDKGLDSLVSLHFGNAPYFVFVDVTAGQILGFYVRANEGSKLIRKKGIQAANLLVEENADVALAGAIGEGPFHMLGDNLIKVYILPKSMEIKDAVRLLTENSLERMVAPTETHQEDRKVIDLE